jgi:2-polyprenyl-3-methyl-5-hydroxy-6-metoxy-1,4-benzoquinol methylase
MCPLCASADTVAAFTKDGVNYRDCRSCGFRYSSPQVNPNLYTAIDDYTEAYLQYLAPEPADKTNFDALREWIDRQTPLRGKRVLDVGAGGGKFVRYLRASGVDVVGLEPSRVLFDRFLAGDPAFTCELLDQYSQSAGTQFDVITAFDVIEHVVSPSEFLGHVASLLKPGGLFVVSTPDVASVAARIFGRRWHFYYPFHLSFFSQRTLARAAERHGLTLVEVTHRGRRRSIGYMIRYAAEYILGRPAPQWASRFDSWYLPTNLFDVMHLCFRRTGGDAAATLAVDKMRSHDRLADRFDDLMNEYDVSRRVDVLVHNFLGGEDLRGRRVLDAGCGTGRATAALADRGAEVVAFDIGERLVARARRRCECRPAVGSVMSLPFADATFDVVLSTEVIEHLPQPSLAIREFARVLKPGGHLVLSVPNWLWQGPVRLASALGLRPYEAFENFLTPGELRAAAAASGLTIVEHRGIHVLPFQIPGIHPVLKYMDRFGARLLPLMINQCLHAVKR